MKTSMHITDDDLHAWLDGALSHERAQQVDAYLSTHPDERKRVDAWRKQKESLKALFNPVLEDPIPARLKRAAMTPPRHSGYRQFPQIAAAITIAIISGFIGWNLHDSGKTLRFIAQQPAITTSESGLGLAKEAAIAHAVYAPDKRRPVEIDAAHEELLIKWLSNRMKAPMNPPHLQSVGYSLEGGRLLPGNAGPVAQFMYQNQEGKKLTLYVSNESASNPVGEKKPGNVAFSFAKQGNIGVFYWIDNGFGYALSAEEDRNTLAQVSTVVWQQLIGTRTGLGECEKAHINQS